MTTVIHCYVHSRKELYLVVFPRELWASKNRKVERTLVNNFTEKMHSKLPLGLTIHLAKKKYESQDKLKSQFCHFGCSITVGICRRFAFLSSTEVTINFAAFLCKSGRGYGRRWMNLQIYLLSLSSSSLSSSSGFH